MKELSKEAIAIHNLSTIERLYGKKSWQYQYALYDIKHFGGC